MEANNDFPHRAVATSMQPFSEKPDYSYVLPNLDFSVDFTDALKGRVSFGKTIARAPYGNLYAGPSAPAADRLGPARSVRPRQRRRAEPGLKPLESDNLDLPSSGTSPSQLRVGDLWNKRVDNFIGNTVVQEPLYGMTDPTSGPDAQAALAFLQSAACLTQVAAAGNDARGLLG